MKIRLFTIPNLLTLSNLLSGAFATVAALVFDDLTLAFRLIVLAAVFDFFDGFAARLLRCPSEIGIQLDSLADDISFGLAPSAVLYALYGRAEALWIGPAEWIGLTVFLFAAFAALRLAKFNIDQTQHTEFEGLPSPAAALLATSAAMLTERYGWVPPSEAVLATALFCAVMMVSPVRMFALKFKGFGWKGNQLRYTFIALSALMLLFAGWAAVPAIILLYVLVSTVRWIVARPQCGE